MGNFSVKCIRLHQSGLALQRVPGRSRIDQRAGGGDPMTTSNVLSSPNNKNSAVRRRTVMLATPVRYLAIAYPIALIAAILALRFIGERWWATTVALYAPRLLLAMPLLPLIACIVWLGPWRLLWTQVLATAALLVLMGFRVGWPPAATPGAFRLRVVSCNIDTGSFGIDTVIRSLRAADADLIVLQAVHPNNYESLRTGFTGYAIRESGQFWVASRFPIRDLMEPQELLHAGVLRSPRFVRYHIVTPAGPIAVYNVHPISPRDGLEELRGDGFRHQLLRGALFEAKTRGVVIDNTRLRMQQLRTIVTDARQSSIPVLIAGDTNLPALSWAFAHLLGDYRDGFAAVGTGLGYTFPAPRHAWMRIDRIVADSRWRFLQFKVIAAVLSDHYGVSAELEMRDAAAARPQ